MAENELLLLSYDNYVDYLNGWIKSLPSGGHGVRSKLARFLNIQTSSLSRILNGTNDLRDGDIARVSEYIGHNELEKKYFHFFVLEGKAETQALKIFYKNCREEMKPELTKAKKWKKAETPKSKEELFSKYYEDWRYSASHILSTIGQVKPEELSLRMGMPSGEVEKILDYLAEIGILKRQDDAYVKNAGSVYIPPSHQFTTSHHVNWRLKSIENVKFRKADDLHYTSVFSCSESDFKKLKEKLRFFIKDTSAQIEDSKEENIFCFNIDLFPPLKG